VAEPAPIAAVPEAQADPEGEPGTLAPLVLDFGAGFMYLFDSSELDEYAAIGRAGVYALTDAGFVVGGSLEGGALFEAFNHNQPYFRLCADPRFELAIDIARFGVGPKVCISTSRHIQGGADEWTGGFVAGGFLRAMIAVYETLSIAIRIDGEAWKRDVLDSSLERAYPWVGGLSATLEIDVR
jgi:hypothetical protein